MSRNETLAALRAEARTAIDACDWKRAEALLRRHAARDRHGEVRVLPLWRALEEGRGTRARSTAHVAAFVAAHPARAASPIVRLERGLALRASGDMDASRAELLAARDALRDGGDPEALALAENGIGLTYLAPLDPTRARRAFQRARAAAAKAGLYDRVAVADVNIAHVELALGALEKAARAYRGALAACRRANDLTGVRLASYNLGNCLADLGRSSSARRHLLEARALATKRDEAWHAAWCTLILGDLDRRAGRAAQAAAAYDEVERAFARLGGPSPTERAWVVVRRAELALDRGDLRAARVAARPALDPRVEEIPRLYGRMLRAVARARGKPSAAAARALERIAVEAERAAVVELAWRARAEASRVRVERAVARRIEGHARSARDPDATAAADDARRALADVERSMQAMGPSGRRAFLRLHERDARWLLVAEVLAGAPAAAGADDAAGRAAWLRLLAHVRDAAAAESIEAAIDRLLDAIIDLSGAARAWALIDAEVAGAAIERGRDADRRALDPRRDRARATATRRPLLHGARIAGALRLDPPEGHGGFSEGVLEHVDVLGSLLCVVAAAMHARRELAARARAQEDEAQKLAVELARAEAALGEARTKLEDRGDEPHRDRRGAMLGRSRPMRELFARLDRIRAVELPVLVTGESGTGKELVARAIHDESRRSSGPFVAINCGAMAEALLESELFGHVRGAFTGAERDAPGLFVVADRGTLFLDEIGEMSLAMQAKLLRVLQEGEVRAVGGGSVRRTDVRIVAATHRDLEALVASGRFREDLYYRLHVLTVHVPPLRARGDDVLLLARQVLEQLPRPRRLAPDAATWLLRQSWPGNVRELRAVVESAAVLSDAEVLDAAAFAPVRRTQPSAGAHDREPPPERLADLEAWAIRRALAAHDGSRVRAARSLGIGRATLYRRLAALGIA